VQNAVPRRHIGSATALTQFSRQMGATIGVTVMGAIVNYGLPSGLGGSEGIGIHRLPLKGREELAAALRPAFLVAACVSVMVWLVAVIWVKEQPLRRSLDEIAVVEADAGAPG
jgi:sugar phosphate permease